MSYLKTNWQDLPNTTTPVNANNLNKMENGIADANGAIGATAYSSSATYAVGDICIYNNKLYRCNTAISTAEAWNSNHWTEINLLDNSILITSESSGVVTGTNKKINVSNIQGNATTSANGLMSSTDKTILERVGLGNDLLPHYSGNIDNLSYTGFFYLTDATSSTVTIPANGYFINLIYNASWRIQIYMSANNITPKYRRKINGTWETSWHDF